MNLIKIREIVTLTVVGDFEVEITGPKQAKTAVIFVHGFGVKRDSRGMFRDIEALVSDAMLCVRTEFSQVHSNACTALPFSMQQSRLSAVTDYVQDKFNIDKLIYIGHSQGCITIGLEQPQGAQILLLAPPVNSPFEEFIKTPGWKNTGSYLNIQGQSRLVRSDLVIDVEPAFWNEFRQINDKILYSRLNAHNEVTIIFAGADQVLGQQQHPPDMTTDTIADADHDFTAASRNALLSLISKKLPKI